MSTLAVYPPAPAFPPMLVVSLNTTCDYACVHCFHRHYVRSPHYAPHYMSRDVFGKIAAELGRNPGASLRLIAWGEPLLHPDIVEFAAIARRNAPENVLSLITNGYHLTPALSLALMEAGLDLIDVSIDAASPATYRRVRIAPVPDAFERVTGNVRAMVAQRNGGGYRTRLAVSFIVWPDEASRAEYETFAAAWAGQVDEVIRRPLHTFKGTVQAGSELPAVRRPCRGLWSRCNINPWGQVNLCYNDWENRYVLGDLRDPCQTIAAVWQGPVLNRLREEQCRGAFGQPCASCRDYNPDAWEHPYDLVTARCRS